jgi:hypothetical protein
MENKPEETVDPPDFEALRAKRNQRFSEQLKKMAEELGIPQEKLLVSQNPDACYCACSTNGPCEHKWNGEGVEIGNSWSVTCSRCGCTALSHDMRTGIW